MMCDDPNLTAEGMLARMAELVQRFGHAIQYVEGDRYRAPFGYTVGLTRRDKPELVVTGLPSDRTGSLLRGLADHLAHADPPAPGEQFQPEGTPMLEVVEVAEPGAHLLTACSLYGPRVRGLQLVWSDDRGKWPWDRGFRSRKWPQPVLGARAPAADAGTGLWPPGSPAPPQEGKTG